METTLTPETDANAKTTDWLTGQYVVDADFARKLERERDEARQALSGRTVSCSQCNEMAKRIDELEGGSFHSCHDQCQRPACVKRREKDAAIAELNQRLTEQRESFMSQLVRIEDGWREKLREKNAQIVAFREALTRINSCADSPDIDVGGEMQIGLHCGVEDRGCRDRYEGADVGWSQGVERTLEWAQNEAAVALEKSEALARQ